MDEGAKYRELRVRLRGRGDPKSRTTRKSFWNAVRFTGEVKDKEAEEPDLSLLNDYTLRRFLIARKWNVKKAEKMVRDWAKWRLMNDVDNLLTPTGDSNVLVFTSRSNMDNISGKLPEEPSDILFQALIPCCNFGVDKQGRPIYW
eukprot:357311-Amorphochlora_amoeboformis.AAC.1